MARCRCGQGHCGGANIFGERWAEGDLNRYRKKGPNRTTRLLLDALKAEGVAELTLLDIGGGVGAIALELLKAGLTTATEVEASSAYASAARTEVARQAVDARIECREGDFVAVAAEIPTADVVTLDRVLCCYPDMPALVGRSTAKAARLYGVVYPRDTWWARVGIALGNILLSVMRLPLHMYSHSTVAVDETIRASGLAPRFHRDAGFWQVAIYARAA